MLQESSTTAFISRIKREKKHFSNAVLIFFFKNKDYFNLFSQDGARAPRRGEKKGAGQERLADL